MKLTSAQLWLIHSLEALALGAIVTAVAILFPHAQDGTLTWQVLLAGLVSAVVAVASKSGASILSNAQTAQALQDTVTQAVQQATPTPVVIHNNIPAAPQPAALPVQLPATAATTQANVQQFQQPAPKSWTSLETPVVTAPTQ